MLLKSVWGFLHKACMLLWLLLLLFFWMLRATTSPWVWEQRAIILYPDASHKGKQSTVPCDVTVKPGSLVGFHQGKLGCLVTADQKAGVSNRFRRARNKMCGTHRMALSWQSSQRSSRNYFFFSSVLVSGTWGSGFWGSITHVSYDFFFFFFWS